MPNADALSDALTELRDAVRLEDAMALADSDPGPSVSPLNTHIHLPPNFSAFQTVAEAVNAASTEGITVLGASNYYDYSVYDEFARSAIAAGIYPLFGMEVVALDDAMAERGVRVNDPVNPGKAYICGLGITRFSEPTERASATLDRIRHADTVRMAAMVHRIAGVLAERGLYAPVTAEGVRHTVSVWHRARHEAIVLQERHVARAFQEAAFEAISAPERAETLSSLLGTEVGDDPVAVQNAIRSTLMKAGRPGYVEERFVTVEEARHLVLNLGGVPVYPTLLDGLAGLTEYERPAGEFVQRVRETGFHATAFMPFRNDSALLREYVLALREAGIVVTAGTEHNTPERMPLRIACKGGAPVPPDVDAVFREGASVMVAHQFLRLHDLGGFVDEQGRPSPGYASMEDRIARFSALGAAIVRLFVERSHA